MATPEGLSSYSAMVKIRPYQEADAAAMAGLVTVLGYGAEAEEMRCRLASLSNDHHTLIAELDGKAAGFIGLVSLAVYEHSRRIGYILALAVSPDQQRKGIGKALVAVAEDWFREEGVRDIRVSSGFHREDAHGFYEAAGYEKTGFRFRKMLGEDLATD